MASYHLRSSEVADFKQDLKNGVTLHCHKNNVFKIDADILVVSRKGSVESCVREKVGRTEWDKKIYDAKFISEWKFVKIFKSKCKPNFSTVYVAHVPAYSKSYALSFTSWLKDYKKLIKNLLTEAENDKKTSITIPLLGTNAGGAPKDECVRKVLEAILKFDKILYLRKINVVVHDWPEYFLLKDLVAEKSEKTYKNIEKNKRKPHLVPVTKSHDTANHGCPQGPDKHQSANRYDGLTNQNSHSHGNGARRDKSRGDNHDLRPRSGSRSRSGGASNSNSTSKHDGDYDSERRAVGISKGDNPDFRHRSNSHSRSSGASNSYPTFKHDDFKRQTSNENSWNGSSRNSPTSDRPFVRDGGAIQNTPGFGINGSSAQKDTVLRTQGSEYSEYQMADHSLKSQKDRAQENVRRKIENGDVKHPQHNSLHSDKDSYAKVVTKNSKAESDHHNTSNGHFSRSNDKTEDEEYSLEYAASHRTHGMDSDHKNYSGALLQNESSFKHMSRQEQSKLNSEFYEARLQELNDSEDEDDRNRPSHKMVDASKKEELESRHQTAKFDNNESTSSHNVKDMNGVVIDGASDTHPTTKYREFWCTKCERRAYIRYELPCHHVFCYKCLPYGQRCQLCKVNDEKFKKADDHNSFNAVQSSSLQTHGEDRTNTQKEYHCKSCFSYTSMKLFALQCQHSCCLDCFDYRKSCQQCQAERCEKEAVNGAEPSYEVESSNEPTNGRSQDNTVEGNCYRCDSSLKNNSPVQLSCGHTFCASCERKGCHDPVCKKGLSREEARQYASQPSNGDERSTDKKPSKETPRYELSYRGQMPSKGSLGDEPKGQSSSQSTNGDESNTDKKPSKENPKDDRNYGGQMPSKGSLGDEPKGQSSSQSTNREGQDNTKEENCHGCKVNLTNNSPVELCCGHVFCAKCERKGCNDPVCIKEGNKDHLLTNDSTYNKVQSSSQPTNGEGNAIEEKCHRCRVNLANNSPVELCCGHVFCAKCERKGCNDPVCIKEGSEDHPLTIDLTYNKERVQSSSQPTNREGRDISIVRKCNRCKLNLANNSPVQLGCGHTFCKKCSIKGCNDPLCIEESEGDEDETPSKGSLEDDHSYRDQRPGENHGNRDQRSSKVSPEDEPSNRDQRPSKSSLEGQSSKDAKGQSSKEPTNGEGQNKSKEEKCYNCNVNLTNNSPVQLGCGHTFCAKCASKGCDDPSCQDELDFDQDLDLQGSSFSQDVSDNHSNKVGNHSIGDNHSNKFGNHGNKDGNHRDRDNIHGDYNSNKDGNHSNRVNKDGSHRYRGSIHGDYNSSKDGNHRDNHRDRRDGNRGDYPRDSHGNRDWNEGGSKHREVDQSLKDAEKAEMCAICMDDITDPKKLEKCGHVFCRKCINDCFKLHKPVCPSCGTMYGVTYGNMPAGTMDVYKSTISIEGFKKCGSFCINYQFNSGTQGPEHPNPGVRYNYTSRVAYLPASPKGVQVLKMLKIAFKRRLTFTVGRSTTTGRENVVTWNDIHHKTSMTGGPTMFGYPDPTYLTRVEEELASKGVTLDDTRGVSDKNETITVS